MSIIATMLKTLNSTKVLGALAVYSGAGALKSTIGGAIDSTEAFAGQDPSAWERAGYNAGAVAAEGTMFLTDLFWLGHFKRRNSWGTIDDAFKVGKKGSERFYVKHGGEMFNIENFKTSSGADRWKRGAAITESSVVAKIEREGAAGVLKRSGKFLGDAGARTMVRALGIPLAIGMMAPLALGFAGKVLDEAYNERRRMTEIHYDNRFFNTDKYDASTYQQLGAAMNSYQSKMVSLARVFHAR